MLCFIDAPGFGEILMIVFVALLVYGGKLPDVARKLGRGVADIKKGVDSFRGQMEKEVESALEPPKEYETPSPPPPPPSDPGKDPVNRI